MERSPSPKAETNNKKYNKIMEPVYLRIQNVEEGTLNDIIRSTREVAEVHNKNVNFIATGLMKVDALTKDRIKLLKTDSEKKAKRRETAKIYNAKPEQRDKRKRQSEDPVVRQKRRENAQREGESEKKKKSAKIRRRAFRLMEMHEFPLVYSYLEEARKDVESKEAALNESLQGDETEDTVEEPELKKQKTDSQ